MKKKTVKKKIKINYEHLWEIGKPYLIRTVTMYYTGRLAAITEQELLLTEAAWIADTGRFHDCLKNLTFNEVEPFINPVIIGRGSLLDATIWNGELPKVQK